MIGDGLIVGLSHLDLLSGIEKTSVSVMIESRHVCWLGVMLGELWDPMARVIIDSSIIF